MEWSGDKGDDAHGSVVVDELEGGRSRYEVLAVRVRQGLGFTEADVTAAHPDDPKGVRAFIFEIRTCDAHECREGSNEVTYYVNRQRADQGHLTMRGPGL